jgi:sigma-B regulation protein RsbU (phosphoserine phosphatase)
MANLKNLVTVNGEIVSDPDTILKAVFLGLVIFMAFINGFRCKWIHYLNKQQKVAFFFFFMFVNSFATILLFFYSNDFIKEYSHIFKTFYQYLVITCTVYSGMALLGILFLLPSAGMLDRRLREIQSLQNLSASIGSVFDRDELTAVTTELARKIVHADFTWIELKESDGFQLAAAYNIKEDDIKEIPNAVLSVFRKEVKESETAFLINDLPKDHRTREIRRWKRKAGSLLVSPIRFKTKDLGLLYALNRETYAFAEESRALFKAFSDQVALALENTNLIQITIDQEVYREELRVAHEAQMRILPQKMPEVEGIELDAFCATANEIGGDFYDLIQVNEDRLDIVIGDVSGKGPNAAFYMAELKGVIQALAPLFSSPKQILLEMNKFAVNHFEADTFATLVYGIFLPQKKQLELVRAGHPPAGLIRKKKVTWLETEGVGIGLASNTVFSKTLKKKMIQLQKGDVVFFHTDGLMEARDSQGEEFGEALLTETLLQASDKDAASVLSEVRHSMEQFTEGVPRHDDVTLVALGLV